MVDVFGGCRSPFGQGSFPSPPHGRVGFSIRLYLVIPQKRQKKQLWFPLICS